LKNLQFVYHLDLRWLSTLDDVIWRAIDAGLNVILDEQDFHSRAKDATGCAGRLLAF
jgi:hypothetical protein